MLALTLLLMLQGGDLTDAQGGNGLETPDAAACAAECEQRSVCQGHILIRRPQVLDHLCFSPFAFIWGTEPY